ncbi:MAG: hypothetical protein CMI18_11060 [Opitutaceae bacterium]|nr:hypothetical protein [Opitutaceae bacterium]|tara:strand:+ start:5021 stop:6040 length:1020 start_codon:yes stop_codon:yes gene_type:complete
MNFHFSNRPASSLILIGVLLFIVSGAFGATVKNMRLAHLYQPDSPSGMGLQFFADKVEEYSEGRIQMKVFTAGQLGSARNLYISTKTGAIDFCVPAFALLADTVPEMTIMNSGYLFEDIEDVERVLRDPELGQKWNDEIIKKCHLRLLGAFYYGKRIVTTKDNPFINPDGVKGLKIRAVPNPMSLAVITGLGGNPTPMAYKEVFIGLSQGVIDGQENPYPAIWSMKFYEVQKYAIETFHQFNTLPLAISEQSWQELDEIDRRVVQKAAVEALAYASDLTRQFEAEIAEKLKAEGMTIIPYDEIAIEEFEKSVRDTIRNRFDGKVWPAGLMDAVLAVGDD